MCKGKPQSTFPQSLPRFLIPAGRGAVKGVSPEGAVPRPYDLRSVARTGGGRPEAPEGSEGPLTAGSPPGPTLMGRGGSGLGGGQMAGG